MGKIQCVSQGRNAITWDLVEKSLKNANTPLERKIHDEYYLLKNNFKENKSASNKDKLEVFIKWYKMCHCDKNGNVVLDKEEREKEDSKEGGYNHYNHYNQSRSLTSSGKKLNFLRKESLSSGVENLEADKWKNLSSIDYCYTESNCNSVSLSSISSSLQLNMDNLFEVNLRNFAERSRSRFKERITKGPTDSFRWLSWVVSGELPLERNGEVYMNYYLEKVDEQSDSQIKKDLNRTLVEFLSTEINFDDRGLNENNDPAHNYLYRVLRAFSNLDKEVAYCQGMNFIVGFLLIVSDFNELDAFYMLVSLFSNTYSHKFGIRGFFIESFPMLKAYSHIFNHFFKEKLPNLHKHFVRLELPDEVWISKWIQTLFTICLPYEASIRLWDCLLTYGLEFIINFSLAFVKQFEANLLTLDDSFDVIDYFKKVFAGKLNNSNIEEIIQTAKKIEIKSSEVDSVKREYEKLNHINLDSFEKTYDIKIPAKKSLFSENLPSTLCQTKTFNSSCTNDHNAFVICREQCKYEINVDKKEIDLELDDDCADVNIEEDQEEELIDLKIFNYTLTPRMKADK